MASVSPSPVPSPQTTSNTHEKRQHVSSGEKQPEVPGGTVTDTAGQTLHQAAQYAQQLTDYTKQYGHSLGQSLQEGNLTQKAQVQVQQARRTFRQSLQEGIQFAKKHPMLAASAMAWAFTAGLILSSLGFTLFGVIPWLLGSSGQQYGWSRSSPQFEAHRALDTVLKSTFGRQQPGMYNRMGDMLHGVGESMGMGKQHEEGNVERAYHYLRDTLSPSQESSFKDYIPGFRPSSQQHSFKDYIPGMKSGSEHSFKDYIPGMKSGNEYFSGSMMPESKGVLGRLMDNVKYYTGVSDIAKLEKAERELREVLRQHRGDL